MGMACEPHCGRGARRSGDGHRVSPRRRPGGARPRPSERRDGKCRNFTGGVHRPAGKSRNFAAPGVHRLGAVPGAPRECVRAASGADRGGGPGWPQCDGDLAGPRRRQRLHGPLCERPSLRPAAPAHRAAGRARRHRHHAGRGGAGRLRRRADGPPSGDGEIPTDAALCPDPRALTQSRAAADVAVERADVGGAPRARVSAPRGHAADGRPR